MKDRRVLNENGLLVFPEREPYDFGKKNKPYSCDYHTGGATGALFRKVVKEVNEETNAKYMV